MKAFVSGAQDHVEVTFDLLSIQYQICIPTLNSIHNATNLIIRLRRTA